MHDPINLFVVGSGSSRCFHRAIQSIRSNPVKSCSRTSSNSDPFEAPKQILLRSSTERL
ncbi:hypothetical protein XENOCAPTIV_012490, partial [Xenoophorus captivus]